MAAHNYFADSLSNLLWQHFHPILYLSKSPSSLKEINVWKCGLVGNTLPGPPVSMFPRNEQCCNSTSCFPLHFLPLPMKMSDLVDCWYKQTPASKRLHPFIGQVGHFNSLLPLLTLLCVPEQLVLSMKVLYFLLHVTIYWGRHSPRKHLFTQHIATKSIYINVAFTLWHLLIQGLRGV